MAKDAVGTALYSLDAARWPRVLQTTPHLQAGLSALTKKRFDERAYQMCESGAVIAILRVPEGAGGRFLAVTAGGRSAQEHRNLTQKLLHHTSKAKFDSFINLLKFAKSIYF